MSIDSSVHERAPRDWDARMRAALARSGITPLTLDPTPEGAVEWSVGATYRQVTRRRLDLVRFEVGYSRDASRAHPWWIHTMVRDTWAPAKPEGMDRDRWIAETLPREAQDWLVHWGEENPGSCHRPLGTCETTLRIDGSAYPAREMRIPDHRAVIADAPSLGVAVLVFLRRDDRESVAVRSLTIEHPV